MKNQLLLCRNHEKIKKTKEVHIRVAYKETFIFRYVRILYCEMTNNFNLKFIITTIANGSEHMYAINGMIYILSHYFIIQFKTKKQNLSCLNTNLKTNKWVLTVIFHVSI